MVREGFRVHRGLVDSQGNRALYCRSRSDSRVTLNALDYELVAELAERNRDRSYSLLFHNEYGAGWLMRLDDVDHARWRVSLNPRWDHLGACQRIHPPRDFSELGRIAPFKDIIEIGTRDLRVGSRKPLPPGTATQLLEQSAADSPF